MFKIGAPGWADIIPCHVKAIGPLEPSGKPGWAKQMLPSVNIEVFSIPFSIDVYCHTTPAASATLQVPDVPSEESETVSLARS